MTSLTATPYKEPLKIQASSPFNWWAVGSVERATWGEPFVLSVALKTPEARLHYDHTLTSTVLGPYWCRNLASEGFKIELGAATLTFDASREFSFKDPAATSKMLAPVYGRIVRLSSTIQGAVVQKSVSISSRSVLGETAVDHFVTFRFDGKDKLEVFLNGTLLMVTSVTVDPSALVLSQFKLSMTPISDSKGEMVLNTPWDLTLPVEPDYSIVAHSDVSMYPTQYVGYSSKVSYIGMKRNSTDAPSSLGDSAVASRLGSAFIEVNSEMDIPYPVLSLAKNHTGYLNLQVVSADGTALNTSRNFSIQWASQVLGFGNFTNGHFATTIKSTVSGAGFISVVDGAGFEYSLRNPVYLVVS